LASYKRNLILRVADFPWFAEPCLVSHPWANNTAGTMQHRIAAGDLQAVRLIPALLS
jgi:hypothetical protein